MSDVPTLAKKPYRAHFFICHGKSCSEKGNPEAAKKFFKEHIKQGNLKDELRACTSSCLDHCAFGPNIVVYPAGTWYSGVQESEWIKIFNAHK